MKKKEESIIFAVKNTYFVERNFTLDNNLLKHSHASAAEIFRLTSHTYGLHDISGFFNVYLLLFR